MLRIDCIGKESIGEVGAEFISDAIQELAQRKVKPINIAFPGGRSILSLLPVLSTKISELPRSVQESLHFWYVDERISHDQQILNRAIVDSGFLQPLYDSGIVQTGQVHIPDQQLAPAQLVSSYNDEFRRTTPLSEVPKIHIAILGAGEDGHVASLFPQHPSVMNGGEFFILVENAPKEPPLRISASHALLERSDYAVLLFVGSEKKEAFASFELGAKTEDCPAALVRRISNALVLAAL